MCSRIKNPKADRLMLTGQLALVAGMVSLQAHRWLALPPDLADGISGLFYGIAIGSMLWSLRVRRHS